MKSSLYIIFCLVSLNDTFAQSITLQPGAFQLPRVATNPACAVADKGKVVFNTNQNKILYCNGSAWIDPESGTGVRITPAFSAVNYLGQVVKSDLEIIEFPDEDFDLNNNFNLDDSETYPNTFVVPDNGIYEFQLNAKLDLSGFVPLAGTRIQIGISRAFSNGGSNSYFEFPVKDYSDNDYIHLSKILRLAAGNRVSFYIRILNPPTYGAMEIEEIYLSGKLVSWY